MQVEGSKNTRWVKTLYTLCIFIVGASLASAGSGKSSPNASEISPDLDSRNGSGQVDAIIEFNVLRGNGAVENDSVLWGSSVLRGRAALDPELSINGDT